MIVSILTKTFTTSSSASSYFYLEKSEEKMARLPIMKKVQQVRSLSALWKHRRQLMRMLKEIIRGSYRASFLTTVAVIAALIYIISPIDLLPDVIPVLGWTDDGIVFYFLLKGLMREMDRFEASKRGVINLVKE